MAAATAFIAPCGLAACLSNPNPNPNHRPHRLSLIQPRRPHLLRMLRSVQTPTTGPAKPAPAPAPPSEADTIQRYITQEYKFGFVSDIESFTIPKGLNENTIRLIAEIKKEPDWLLKFRLDAYAKFCTMTEPTWSDNVYPPIDLQSIRYYSAPKIKPKLNSLDEADPEHRNMLTKLNISIAEQERLLNVRPSEDAEKPSEDAEKAKRVIDFVVDSTSLSAQSPELAEIGVIFCSISEAVRKYPDLVRRYLGKVVPPGDNYFAALNSAVFSDGSFCYVPKGVKCTKDLETVFRMNDKESGQFERTLIICEDDAFVSYLEGCTAPAYDRNQLHAAVVELYAHERAEIKYSTVQNWFAGDAEGRGGIYNFVTKRGRCAGKGSKISWTQVETGAAITWKYPSVELVGDDSVGEFYSVAVTKNCQQADTGTKMIHKGKNTRSRIVSKGISAGRSMNCYRGQVQMNASAGNARNFSQCDSLLIGDTAGANTYPTIQVGCRSGRVEHEASTSKIGEDQIFYFRQRGIAPEKAVAAMVAGFCNEVFNELPMEFSAEVDDLMRVSLEGSVG